MEMNLGSTIFSALFLKLKCYYKEIADMKKTHMEINQIQIYTSQVTPVNSN